MSSKLLYIITVIVVEALADMPANCTIDTAYITVESEFSALSACLGASAAGSRVYSATTSQGLALMFEVCFNCAGMRLPVVMSIVNRALAAPLSIWNDQQDSISLRDSGWFQMYAEDNQEADLHYLASKVPEDHRILLPSFVCFDGFILSHTYEPVDTLTQEQVDAYLPPFRPYQRLDAADPVSFGLFASSTSRASAPGVSTGPSRTIPLPPRTRRRDEDRRRSERRGRLLRRRPSPSQGRP